MGVIVNRMLLPLCALLAFAPATYAACNSNIPHYSSKRFVVNSDGTVTDTSLRLVWMQCELGARWDTAKKACVSNPNDSPRLRVQWQNALIETQKFNNAGGFAAKADWRMPNIKELSSLVNYACLNGTEIGIDPAIFPNAAADVWSSTPGANQRKNVAGILTNTAWVVSFNSGKLNDEWIDDPEVLHYIRLVRDAN